MRISRHYTTEGQSPYETISFRTATSEIRNPDGSIVFRLDDMQVPTAWSQVATDVLAQKYFRKAGVPARLKKVEENSVPSWLWRSVADEEALAALPEAERYISEIDARQVFDRLAGTWTYWGWKAGYFSSEEDARAFFDELCYMLATQKAAPNSPQWFNTGLHWAYGIDGPSQGHYYVDHWTKELVKSETAYEHPQPHACFIQSISDDLVNDGGIMDLWVREARLFKYGSGTGSNFSRPARRRRAALRRRQVVRPDELPQDRRPRGRRHQVGRHHAPRRQDGDRRRRPSRHREIHQLEGERGAEGRRPRHRLQDLRQAPLAHHEGLRELRGPRRRLLRPAEEPGAEARGTRRQEGQRAGELHPARHAVRAPGLHQDRVPDLRPRLGLGGLPHRLRPELQQLGARHRRVPARRGERRGRGTSPSASPARWRRPARPRAVGRDQRSRMGLRRSRHPVPHHHQRLAHLPRTTARSSRRTRARNTCSSTTRRAISPR